jgi:hypothetical protein
MRLHRTLAAALGAVALTACGSDAVQELTAPVPSAAVRFFNFGVGSPSVHFFADDRKMTATTSASCQAAKDPPVTATDTTCLQVGIQSTSGIAYGSVGANGQYTGIAPGQYTITGRPMTASGSGTAVSTLPVTIEEGKRYSVYQSGIYDATAKTSDAFIVEDDVPTTIDWGTTLVRFVNASGNAEPLTVVAVDAEDPTVEVQIGTDIAYGSAGAFVPIPPGLYVVHARVGGSTTDAIVRTGVVLEPGRAYTVTARGDMTVTSTTAAARPILDYTVHR